MDDHEVRTTCAGVRDTEARPARGLQSAWARTTYFRSAPDIRTGVNAPYVRKSRQMPPVQWIPATARADPLLDRPRALLDRGIDELGNVGDVELLHHARPVGLHRLG